MKNKILIFLVVLLMAATSCTVSREQYGKYNKEEHDVKTLVKGKDLYLFWDQLSVSKTEHDVDIKHYEKIVKRGFFDFAVYIGTLGIFSFYSVEIKVPEKKKNPNSNLME